jgi:hypothetical protein
MYIRRNEDLQLRRLTASRVRNTSMNYVVLQVTPMLGVKRGGGRSLLPFWQKRLSSGYSQAVRAASPLCAVACDCNNLNITFGQRRFVFRVEQLPKDSWLQ